MKIVICASLDFTKEIKNVAEKLTNQDHQVVIPKTSEMIINGKVTLDQIIKEKENGEISNRIIKYDALRYYFDRIKEADAILVLNFDKKEIKNYIGGAVLLEIGFAHVLSKKIFLLNPIPDISYKYEIKAMKPIILYGDLEKIK